MYIKDNDAPSFALKVKDAAVLLGVSQRKTRFAFAQARKDCKSDPETRRQFGTRLIAA